MLIVIPTFRRNECLRWVLKSLVRCTTDEIPEQVRVLVVCNYPPAGEAVLALVNQFRTELRFKWNVLLREHTLDPVENWYQAIRTEARPDEVVLLHGDDDLFFPWSLTVRWKAMVETRCDMLLTFSNPGLFFSNGATRITQLQSLEVSWSDTIWEEPEWDQIRDFGPAFIGNHAYRITPAFLMGLERAFAWCHTQNWLDLDTRTLMLPFYLPFAIRCTGGYVTGLRTACVLRGREVEEIQMAPFGVPGWNSGFLCLCATGVFRGPDLAPIQLPKTRAELEHMAVQWWLTFFADRRISPSMRRETMKRIPLGWRALLSRAWLKGFRTVFTSAVGLRGFSLRLRVLHKAISCEAFIDRLARLKIS